MSRIGKKPVAIPSGVTVDLSGAKIVVKGPKGELSYEHLPEVTVKVEDDKVFVERKDDTKQSRARHGLTRQLISNMVIGVSEGYEKKLIVEGVGYKVEVKGKELHLALGFSHPVVVAIPEGLDVSAEKNTITIAGIDKELVGSFAAKVRKYRKPEPYKGKGIRYDGEIIRRKQGKRAV